MAKDREGFFERTGEKIDDAIEHVEESVEGIEKKVEAGAKADITAMVAKLVKARSEIAAADRYFVDLCASIVKEGRTFLDAEERRIKELISRLGL